MAKYLVVDDNELIYLHWLIVYRFNIDGQGEVGKGMTGREQDFEMVHKLHDKIRYNIAKPDRTGENAARLEAQEFLGYWS